MSAPATSQASQSSVLLAPLNNRFDALPIELLEEIQMHSANFLLPNVCRCFYLKLNSDSSRLQFCRHIFRRGIDWGSDEDHIRCAQKQILRQDWFTASYAAWLDISMMRSQQKDGSYVKITGLFEHALLTMS